MNWKKVAVLVVSIAAAGPASASVFEIYVRAQGGLEYLDLTAIDSSGLLNPANYNPDSPPAGAGDIVDQMTKEYKGEGWAVGGAAGLILIDFLDVGIDFRQAGLYFDYGNTDGLLTQIALHAGFHFLGTDTLIDPSLVFGLGYCYLTTKIPELSDSTLTAPTEERTANGFIGRVGGALDLRFLDWLSAGIAADFSLLYFDGGSDRTAWGFNTDILARLSIHI